MVINFHSSIFYEFVSIQSRGKLCKEEPASPSNVPLSIHGPTFPLTPFSPFSLRWVPLLPLHYFGSLFRRLPAHFFVAEAQKGPTGKGRKEGGGEITHSAGEIGREGKRRRDDDDDAWKKGKWKRDSSPPPYPGKEKSPHEKDFSNALPVKSIFVRFSPCRREKIHFSSLDTMG